MIYVENGRGRSEYLASKDTNVNLCENMLKDIIGGPFEKSDVADLIP